jgi:hypothetical protein
LTAPMAVLLIANLFRGNFVQAVNRVCYYIKQNHKAYLSHAKKVEKSPLD